MPPDSGLAEIAHVIQLAVAPVFLLAGVAGILNVLTHRLARIIDRSRVLEPIIAGAETSQKTTAERELQVLGKRSRAVNFAITLVTLCALLVCAVIAALFLGVFFELDVSRGVGWVFIAAMVSLILGLIAFLREVQLSNRGLRIASGGKLG